MYTTRIILVPQFLAVEPNMFQLGDNQASHCTVLIAHNWIIIEDCNYNVNHN